MKKELSLAVLIGLILGLIITYGVYRARRAEQETAVQTTESIAGQVEGEPLASNQVITLSSPADESVQAFPEIKIAGTTKPNIFVIIFIGEDEFITTADNTGNFAIEGKLTAGGNVISVQTLDEEGQVNKIERVVIYTEVDYLSDDSATDPNL